MYPYKSFNFDVYSLKSEISYMPLKNLVSYMRTLISVEMPLHETLIHTKPTSPVNWMTPQLKISFVRNYSCEEYIGWLDLKGYILSRLHYCRDIFLEALHAFSRCQSWLFFVWNLQSKILHYMRQMAVITPYAQFLFKFISDTAE